jgi:hypothetical protein
MTVLQEMRDKLTTYFAVGLIGVGFFLMFMAWHYSANLDYVQGQFPYLLSATAPGLAFVMVGLTLAVIQELRRNTAAIVQRLDATGTPATVPVADSHGLAAPVDAPEGDYVLATSVTFHAPDCEVIAGRTDLTPLEPQVATDRGLAACRICDPVPASSGQPGATTEPAFA